MKQIKMFFIAACALAATSLHAQTVDEIVAKNTEAMGGKDKLSKLKTVRMTGGMNMQGTDINITMTKSQAAGVRVDIEANGTSNYQLVNPTAGWVFMPVMGMAEPTKMDDAQLKSFTAQMDIQGALFNYKDKGNTVVLDGSDKVDGNDAYKLKVTYRNGNMANYYIDKKTNRLVKTSGKTSVQGQDMDVETTFNDYKQNADGYWFPYSITNMQGTINFDKVETNIPVDEKIYTN